MRCCRSIAIKRPTTQFVFWRIVIVVARSEAQGSPALAFRGRTPVFIVVLVLPAIEGTGSSGQEVTKRDHVELSRRVIQRDIEYGKPRNGELGMERVRDGEG